MCVTRGPQHHPQVPLLVDFPTMSDPHTLKTCCGAATPRLVQLTRGFSPIWALGAGLHLPEQFQKGNGVGVLRVTKAL